MAETNPTPSPRRRPAAPKPAAASQQSQDAPAVESTGELPGPVATDVSATMPTAVGEAGLTTLAETQHSMGPAQETAECNPYQPEYGSLRELLGPLNKAEQDVCTRREEFEDAHLAVAAAQECEAKCKTSLVVASERRASIENEIDGLQHRRHQLRELRPLRRADHERRI